MPPPATPTSISEISDRTAPMSIAPMMPALSRDEDAPERQPGVRTGLLMTGRALANAAGTTTTGTGTGDSGGPKAAPWWVVLLFAVIGGGGTQIGANELFGSDAKTQAQVAAFSTRLDAIDGRVDRTEQAIAAGDVMRVAEVRYLIDLSVKGFQRMGVSVEDLPALPAELADRYTKIVVEDTRRKLFPPAVQPPPAPDGSSTMPP